MLWQSATMEYVLSFLIYSLEKVVFTKGYQGWSCKSGPEFWKSYYKERKLGIACLL